MTKQKAGVYEILNIKTKSRYVGVSAHIRGRLRSHLHALRQGEHMSEKMQKDWNLFGEEIFEFNILLFCDDDEFILDQFERRAFKVLSIEEAEFPEYNSRAAGYTRNDGPRSAVSQRRRKFAAYLRKRRIRERHRKYWKIWKERYQEGYREAFLPSDLW